MSEIRSSLSIRVALAALLLCLVPISARGVDGTAPGGGGPPCETCMTSGGGPTYYETLAQDGSLADLESLDATLPTLLEIDDSTAQVRYARTSVAGGRARWEAKLTNFLRNHERVDAVYHMLLVLPVPADFAALDRGIALREGTEAASVPLIYGGDKVVLKRDVALEKALLPGLIGTTEGKLPSLDGTGYVYTLWGSVVQYDAMHEATVQGWASLRYETADTVWGPDAADLRFQAYLVTWVPALRADVRPWAIRMDVTP